MQRIVRRLLMAATDADMRMDMNVEDEYFSIIEKQDTELMIHAKQLAEQRALLKQQDEKMKQQDEKMKQQDEKMKQQDEKMKQQDEKMKSMLYKSVQALKAVGMSVEQIADNLSIRPEMVKEMINQSLFRHGIFRR